MSKGDRIVVGDGYSWQDDGTGKAVPVYKPVLNESGGIQETPDGSAIVQKAGGVTIGSTGVIQGPPIKVPRSYLLVGSDENYTPPMGKDLVEVFPIFLEKYQQIGWLPGDNIRIIGGTPAG